MGMLLQHWIETETERRPQLKTWPRTAPTVSVSRQLSTSTVSLRLTRFKENINEIINQKRQLTEMTLATSENGIGDLSTEELGYVFNIAVDEEDEKNFE